MTFKYAMSCCVASICVIGAYPTVVNAQQQGSDELTAQDDPQGHIVAKILPPRAAASSNASKAPRRITDRRDPEYVRCRSEPIIGSLAKKRRVCMTNKEWAEYTQIGSRNSKEFVEDNQPGFMITPN